MSLNVIRIVNGRSSATIHSYGATVTSWKPLDKEALFVSEKSSFDGQKPIRGGIPVVFPQFGPWNCGPQHGFARRKFWEVKEKNADSVTFILEDSEDTRAIWNYKFSFEYTVSLLSEYELKMSAAITNLDETAEKTLDFTFLLHTYFVVPNVLNSSVLGLEGCSYIDKVLAGQLCTENSKALTLTEFTDRIYQNTPDLVKLLTNGSASPEIIIKKHNLPDTVVWNPWNENAKKMEDFGDEEWKNMICVEAGHVSAPRSLKSGEKYEAYQVLSVKC